MGLQRTNTPAEKGETIKASIIVEKISRPFMVAAKAYHQTNPKEFLELVLIFVAIIFSFIGEIFFTLPWGWYLVLFVLIAGYFNLFNKIHSIFKKKKKK